MSETENGQQLNAYASSIGCFGQLALLSCMVIVCANMFLPAQHSWWVFVALIVIVGPLAFMLAAAQATKVDPPSEAVIENAFTSLRTEQLRAIKISIPPNWRYQRMGRGEHMFSISECGHQAAIGVELEYLHDTEINTMEDYLAYAVEFTQKRKSSLLFNRISKRWGMNVHEFADQSPHTAGQRVTVPFHGTEYGFQLRLNDVRLAPAARRLFEQFLENLRFSPPELVPNKALNGRISIGLPPEFVPTKQVDLETQTWKSQAREDCTIRIVRLTAEPEPMSPRLLNTVIDRSPRPAQANKELSRSRQTTLAENGFGGYIYYQATDTTGWFGAVGDLPTGGRYLFCLEDNDPRQEPYFGVYHYQQIALEILVTLSETIENPPAVKNQEQIAKLLGNASKIAAQNQPATPSELSLGSPEIEWTEAKSLQLDNWGLRELPAEVCQMTHLRELHLRNNALQALPEAIGNLANLESLLVSGNALTSLPESITKLSKLRVLGVSTNAIERLPEGIGEMSSLEEIHIGGNRICDLPVSLGKLRQLVKLNVSNNCLLALPIELNDIPTLECLYLHDNPGLGLTVNELGPSWMEVKMGAPPKPPKELIECWTRAQG